jgi:hypothetical protein
MSGSALALRCRWLRQALSRNALTRFSDRLEAASVLLILLVVLVAVPVAVHTAGRTQASQLAEIAAQHGRSHTVQAVATGQNVAQASRSQRSIVKAQWREGGEVRTTSVVSRSAVPKGTPVTVWLDNRTGDVVEPPRAPSDAAAIAMVVGAGTWLGAVALAALLVALVRLLLNRFRARAWEREIRLLAHNDDGWANRHT